MLKKYHKIWLFGLLILISQNTMALSLGGIKMLSTFAQPFLAEIKIPSYTETEMESIQVHLASKKQFEEKNIEMLPALQQFRFSIEKKDNNTFIKVYTKNPVKELSMSFLIEVTWQGGRIIKSYDVLLTPEAISQFWEQRAKEIIRQVEMEITPEADIITPPTLLADNSDENGENDENSNAKPLIRKASTSTGPTGATASKKTQPTAKSRKWRKTKAGGLEYTSVGRGESLSLIAQRMRPSKDMSINQVMVALFNENRSAFSNNDINRLMAGTMLKIADVTKISDVSKREAMQLAQKYFQGPDNPPQQQPLLAKNEPSEESEKNEEPAVTPEKIESPNNNRLEISSANDDPIAQDIMQQIKNEQIAIAEKELEAARNNVEELSSENKELKERISSLENQLDATAENLFLATIEQEIVKDAPETNSATQQDQNLVVANTDLVMAGDEKLSFIQRLEKYQTAISVSSATLLSLTLLAIRKRSSILDVVHILKEKLGGSKNKNKNKDVSSSKL